MCFRFISFLHRSNIYLLGTTVTLSWESTDNACLHNMPLNSNIQHTTNKAFRSTEMHFKQLLIHRFVLNLVFHIFTTSNNLIYNTTLSSQKFYSHPLKNIMGISFLKLNLHKRWWQTIKLSFERLEIRFYLFFTLRRNVFSNCSTNTFKIVKLFK